MDKYSKCCIILPFKTPVIIQYYINTTDFEGGCDGRGCVCGTFLVTCAQPSPTGIKHSGLSEYPYALSPNCVQAIKPYATNKYCTLFWSTKFLRAAHTTKQGPPPLSPVK
jgi:hypothetical protein